MARIKFVPISLHHIVVKTSQAHSEGKRQSSTDSELPKAPESVSGCLSGSDSIVKDQRTPPNSKPNRQLTKTRLSLSTSKDSTPPAVDMTIEELAREAEMISPRTSKQPAKMSVQKQHQKPSKVSKKSRQTAPSKDRHKAKSRHTATRGLKSAPNKSSSTSSRPIKRRKHQHLAEVLTENISDEDFEWFDDHLPVADGVMRSEQEALDWLVVHCS